MAREASIDDATIQEAIDTGHKVRKGAAARFEKDTVSFLDASDD